MSSNLGRPSLYSKAICDEICARVAAGESIREISSNGHMPDHATVYRWLLDADKAAFCDAYSQALKIHLLAEADELKYIADNAGDTTGEVAKANLQIKVRCWRLSKLDSKKYGDKPISDDEPVTNELDLSLLTTEQFAAYKAAVAAATIKKNRDA